MAASELKVQPQVAQAIARRGATATINIIGRKRAVYAAWLFTQWTGGIGIPRRRADKFIIDSPEQKLKSRIRTLCRSKPAVRTTRVRDDQARRGGPRGNC